MTSTSQPASIPVWLVPIAMALAWSCNYGSAFATELAPRWNLLLVFTDDQTHRTVSAYEESYPWLSTPHIDRVATEGVRLFGAVQHTISNPKTGEVISIGARAGDTEVFFPDVGEWHFIFRWHSGSAAFSARFDPTETTHPVWRAAVALANRLGAAIRGDEGEVYDFQTGEAVDA